MNPLNCRLGVVPPVGGPDADDPPAEILEHLLAGFVAVAGDGRAVVGGAVALDAGKVGAGFVGVNDAEIDAETGDADLGYNLPPASGERLSDRYFEG